MKSLFFIFLILILSGLVLMPFSYATLSGSPSALEYNLDIGQERCLVFVVASNDYHGDLSSIMKWAAKDAQVSSPSDFIYNSSEIELDVSYSPESISGFDGEESILVCISGNEEGMWKGSLEYRTQAEGNIGIGVGTWLRVNITDIPDEEVQEEEEQIPPAAPSNNGGSGGGSGSSEGGSGSGGGSTTTSSASSSTTVNNNVNVTINNIIDNDETPLGELEEEITPSARFGAITGAAVEFTKTTGGKIATGAVLLIVLGFVGFKIYKKKFGSKIGSEKKFRNKGKSK